MDFFELTKKVLVGAFEPDILNPLEEISSRTKLIANREREFDAFFEILDGKPGNTFENLKVVEKDKKDDILLKAGMLPTPGFLSVEYVTELNYEIYGKTFERTIALDPGVEEKNPGKIIWPDKEMIIPIERS